MQALPKLDAVEFRKVLGTGTTKPCVFQCEDSSGKPAGEYATKLRGGVRSNEIGLQYEFIAWHLAEYFNVPHLPAALITIEEELTSTIQDREVREHVKKSIGLNFGTEFRAGFNTWVADDTIPLSLQKTAAEIVAFDAVIENVDRKRDKPNLLFKGDELLVLDHELAFSFIQTVGLNLNNWNSKRLEFLSHHAFQRGLKGKALDLTDFVSTLRGLSNKMITGICDAVPPEFGAVSAKIPAHLKAIRENATTVMDIIREIFK